MGPICKCVRVCVVFGGREENPTHTILEEFIVTVTVLVNLNFRTEVETVNSNERLYTS